MWWNVYGQLVDDTQEGARIPDNAVPLADYGNQAQYGDTRFVWDPAHRWYGGKNEDVAPGYVTGLLALRDRVRSGQARPYEIEQYTQREAQARAIPTRDLSRLTSGWQGGEEGTWSNNVWQAGDDWWTRLDPRSPDVGPIMLQLADKMERGQASADERALFQDVYKMAGDWNWRATVPQESDANPFGLGDNLFGALGTMALGATGGLAAAPLAAGGAGLATTLGSLGTLAGVGGTAAGALGQEMDIDWLRKAGLGLGAAGGIAGGIGGLANLASTGVNSLSDAARLASNAGRVVGGVGRLSHNDVLRQAGGYLGMAGQLGGGIDTMANVLGGQGVNSLTDAARLARGLGQVASVAGRVTGNRPTQQASQMLGLASTLGSLGGGVGGLLSAAQGVQRGAVPFAPVDWLRRA